ncbi:MAG: glycosyltransferase family 2 protein, partial [Acidimicrobiales bacterium]
MSRRPLVSLLIPVRNRPAMLRAALQSAIAQRYEPLEIVVCDNASTDDTAEVARELARSDERVQVYVNEHDVGGFNYPVTLRHSRGELVQFLNSDDVLDPACVERLASAMDRPETVMSFCRAS